MKCVLEVVVLVTHPQPSLIAHCSDISSTKQKSEQWIYFSESIWQLYGWNAIIFMFWRFSGFVCVLCYEEFKKCWNVLLRVKISHWKQNLYQRLEHICILFIFRNLYNLLADVLYSLKVLCLSIYYFLKIACIKSNACLLHTFNIYILHLCTCFWNIVSFFVRIKFPKRYGLLVLEWQFTVSFVFGRNYNKINKHTKN